MLIRVDVYPATGVAYTGDSRDPEQTLHVCLATSAAQDDSNDQGRLLTVGRKTGDVVLPQDKSVSREHLILRIVTTNKSLPQREGIAKPALARTTQEQQACQASSAFYQCAVVLESVGKLGTFILESCADKVTENTEDDSDTDEEGDVMTSQPGLSASQASHMPLSPWLKNLLLLGKQASPSETFRSRLVAQSTTLTQLNQDHGRVVVLCGKQESIVVLTRVPLYVQRSRNAFATHKFPSWWSQLYAAGIVDLSDDLPAHILITPRTTHLVANARSTTHRQLCAWLHGVPCVTAEYLHALLQRTSKTEPLPDVKAYATPASGGSFWQKMPTPRAWRGLTYLSLKRGDEWPDVVEGMGGTVLRLYGEDKHSVGNDDSSDDEDEDDQPFSQSRLAAYDPAVTFSIDCKSRRYTQPLKTAGIPLFSAKQAAMAVCNGQILPGLKPVQAETKSRSKTSEAPAPHKDDERKSPREAAKKRTKSTESPATTTSPKKKSKSDKSSDGAKETSQEKEAAQPTQQSVANTDGAVVHDNTQTRSKEKDAAASAVEKEDTLQTKKRGGEKPVDGEPNEERRVKRIKLGTTSSGWLQAAPSQPSERRAHARTKKEIMEAYEGNAVDLHTKSAVTEWAPLIPHVPPSPTATMTSSKLSRRRRATTGPDYKAFRKNSVPSCHITAHQFQMHRALPTAKQAQLDEEQRDADEQFRKANELFKDDVRPKASGRRRRLQ